MSAVIPVVPPTHDEIEEALRLLEMDPELVSCAYCGDRASEWDHLRPLVKDRRPTGFVSEIANLVPACGKCNQSKGNKPWQDWIVSSAKLSPTWRRVRGLDRRIERLVAFESWRAPTKIDFVAVLGADRWEAYWELCEKLIGEMKRCQTVANQLRVDIAQRLPA